MKMKYRIIEKIYLNGDIWYFLQVRNRILWWCYWSTVLTSIDLEYLKTHMNIKNRGISDFYTLNIIQEYYVEN